MAVPLVMSGCLQSPERMRGPWLPRRAKCFNLSQLGSGPEPEELRRWSPSGSGAHFLDERLTPEGRALKATSRLATEHRGPKARIAIAFEKARDKRNMETVKTELDEPLGQGEGRFCEADEWGRTGGDGIKMVKPPSQL